MKGMCKKTVLACMMSGFLGAMALPAASVEAAPPTDGPIPYYNLNKIVVTASRYEKPDTDIAASTAVLTGLQLKDTGADNLQQALNNVSGLQGVSSRPGGGGINPKSNSDITIRGIKGTLVMVNGMPLNLNNRYELNDIPLDDVKRVEIVKGGGSVLYGSEAVGGVINIITKKTRKNSVAAGFGNYGQQKYDVNFQAGKLGFGYNYKKFGDVDHTSFYKGKYNNTKGSEANNFNATYRITDELTLNAGHNQEISATDYRGPEYKGKGSAKKLVNADTLLVSRHYKTKKDYVQLNYDREDLKGQLYYNYADIANGKNVYVKNFPTDTKLGYNFSKEKNSVIGTDVNKSWELADDTIFLLGASYKHEKFNPDSSAKSVIDYSRNIGSIYVQWDKDLDEENNLILSSRYTKTFGAPDKRNYNNTSSQVQYLHRLDDTESVYASVGQSYKMPTFKQIFGNKGKVVGNPNVKPQKGMHYEIGYKNAQEKYSSKVALFLYKVDDNISAYSRNSAIQYTNEDLKNVGIELSNAVKADDHFSYHYGITWQNPMVKQRDKNGVESDWRHKYGKFQFNSGVTYRDKKWRASLNATYLADRYMLSSSVYEKTKPYLLTSFDLSYKINKTETVLFEMNNLLDRKDNMGNTGSYYYTTPCNFLLSYKYEF